MGWARAQAPSPAPGSPRAGGPESQGVGEPAELGQGEGGGGGWGEPGQMFLEWVSWVIDADWNSEGEHSPRALCSGWRMGWCSCWCCVCMCVCVCVHGGVSLSCPAHVKELSQPCPCPGPHTCPAALTPASPECQAPRQPHTGVMVLTSIAHLYLPQDPLPTIPLPLPGGPTARRPPGAAASHPKNRLPLSLQP